MNSSQSRFLMLSSTPIYKKSLVKTLEFLTVTLFTLKIISPCFLINFDQFSNFAIIRFFIILVFYWYQFLKVYKSLCSFRSFPQIWDLKFPSRMVVKQFMLNMPDNKFIFSNPNLLLVAILVSIIIYPISYTYSMTCSSLISSSSYLLYY